MSLDDLKRQRSNVKRNISRIKSLVELKKGSETKLSADELRCRLGILESYFKKALSIQADIENLDSGDNGRAELEDSYVAIKLCIREQIGGDLNTTVTDPLSPTISAITMRSSSLPKLPLPLFDGNYSNYKNFINSFEKIIASESGLSNIEKFNYLLTCLKGPALETIKAFQVTKENYPKALERLKERYDNPTLTFLEGIAALFALNPVEKSNGQQLRSLVDKASAIFSSLESVGDATNIAQAMLIYIVIDKCDQQTRFKWNESLDYETLPTWSKCTQLLERHCQFLISSGTSSQRKPDHNKPSGRSNQSTNSSFAITNTACTLCSSSGHKITNCSQFKAMNSNQRYDHVKKLGLCINCLGNSHKMAQCSSTHRCRHCNRAHHSSLHHDHPPSSQSSSQPTPVSQPTQPFWQPAPHHQSSQAASHSHMEIAAEDQILLATAMVLVKDSSGEYKLGRALLDSCSQVNFITENFAQKLRLHRERHHIGVRSIGESLTNIKSRTTTSIKSRTSGYQLTLQFGITSHIAYQPDAEIDISNWNLPANTPLADETFFESRRIDLLLGTEAFFDALAVGQIRIGPNLPTLQKTLFGWVVSGRFRRQHTEQSPLCLVTVEDSIDNNLQHLWKIDSIERPIKELHPNHRLCEDQYTSTTHTDSSGRIVVRLPFGEDPKCLGHSADTARNRFLAIEKRLSRLPDILLQYVAFMQEYENLGHMTLVPKPNLDEPHFYIPHHFVLKPSSSSTSLRVVFDASCQTTSQRSLNDILLVGPTIQEELYILLLSFRMYRFVITADVTKMYRQILVHEDDRKFQYIFWRASPDEDLLTYQLNTVTYGTASAPYLATRSLHYMADNCKNDLPMGAAAVKSRFYVDDLLCGADDVDTLLTLKAEIIKILSSGNFPLCKWHSNVPDLMEDNSNKEIHVSENSVSSTLGVIWHQHDDTFSFSFNPKEVYATVTKRTILSTASSLFDPIGLLSPLVIVSKIIMQELWLLKLDWDESVPQNLADAWNNCLESLNSLSTITVPRFCLQPSSCNVQLHAFCDASIRAYGCCFYVRTEDSFGQVTVKLFTSKSRVAPVKKQSLPKLELCGAHLLAQLYDKIKNIFVNHSIKSYFWCDSQLVLYWLQQHSVTLSTFVGNRVSDIQELTSEGHWCHVPTHFNPADLLSRGCRVEDLQNSIWFSGPSFLLENPSKWPTKKKTLDIDMTVVNTEKRKSLFTAVKETNYILDISDRISSYRRTLRIIAWTIRFAKKCRKIPTSTTTSPEPEELRFASNCLIWNLQQTHFAEEIRLLRNQKPLKNNLKFLTPFLDRSTGFELVKVGGRLDYAELPDSQKHPLLLPSSSQFVWKYIRHLHLRNHHAGPKALVALIRLEYWIVNARELARRVVRSCIHCVRYRPKLQQQLMGPLPTARLAPARPFERCGIDFCGPINTYLRIRGKGPTKSYIAMFVCLLSKAVHIEVVSDLSTKAFINALKRMGGRRKLPADIFCDNATNFVGAANQLRELKEFMFKKENQDEIFKFCSNEFISFHFIPPRAPHFGGLWEAAVKSAKGLLNRTLANSKFTLEELSTVAVEIEAILNSRPLTPLSSDPNDYGALTAGHLLVGDSLRSLPERSLEDKNLSNLDRFEMITAVKQRFWKQWSADYINELRARTKWTSPSPNLSEGTLVIIHEDNLPPLRWKLGRVQSTVLGKDGHVRVVHLRTSTGMCCRPIHKLAILPVV